MHLVCVRTFGLFERVFFRVVRFGRAFVLAGHVVGQDIRFLSGHWFRQAVGLFRTVRSLGH